MQTSTAVEGVDAWTSAYADFVRASKKADFGPLEAHCARLRSNRPSKRWLAGAAESVEALGSKVHVELLTTVLAAVGTPSPNPIYVDYDWLDEPTETDPRVVSADYADLLRGFVWSALVGDTAALVSALGDAGVRSFKKIPNIGPNAPKIGNACAHVLGASGSIPAIAQLSRMKLATKHASARAQIDKALAAAAEEAGLDPTELEEIAVPEFGFTGVGVREETLGNFTAVLRLTGSVGAELTWRRADGKPQKSVPAKVKSNNPEALASLRKTAKELKTLLPAQRDRLERLLRGGRTVPYETWRRRYWDQPLVGSLARRLIWRFGDDGPLGIADGDSIVTLDGDALQPDDPCPVALWHPLGSPPALVHTWREYLHEHGITQPFKQAHRELYILTDAERETGTYSNRFAAHVLRQHQFQALCQQRGWHFALLGDFDSCNTPYIDIPGTDWRAEFQVDVPAGLEATTEMGIYLHVATDRVSFTREGTAENLDVVPPLLFSELMRDVDLFVGVCSVGNDPQWRDGGYADTYNRYWEGYAFGEVQASGRSRRDALTRLVPMLKIAERCSLTDRFLVVKGDLRTYKIHLGSGNILMSPNDEYLCIVASGKARPAKVMLPFEGDPLLSIILSKALLLAADTKIKDPTISSQIQR